MTIALLMAALSIACPDDSPGAAGQFDPAFGIGGRVRLGFGIGEDRAHALASPGNGYHFVAGTTEDAGVDQFFVARYLDNGASDATFGLAGVGRLAVGDGLESGTATCLAFQPDGGIVLGGVVGSHPAVARFLSNGTPDPSFGTNGLVVLSGLTIGQVTGIAIQGSRILASCQLRIGNQDHFGLIRLNADGSPDLTFDGDGWVGTPILNSSRAGGLVIQADGKIVIAGYAQDSSFRTAVAVARYDANGVPDATFDGDGVALTYVGSSNAYGHAVTTQATKLVVVGSTGPFNQENGLIIRYNSNGSLDPTLGAAGTGILVQPVGAGDDIFRAVRVVYNSRGSATAIVVTGSTEATSSGSLADILLCRYLLTGALDTSLDGDGIVVTPASGGEDVGRGLTVVNSRILVAGYGRPGLEPDVVLLRYLSSNGAPDTGWDGDGIRFHDIGDATSEASSLTMESGGGLLLTGTAGLGTTRMAVARLTAVGSPDSSFSGDGRLLVPLPTTQDAGAYDHVVQPDGRLVLAGRFGFAMILVRLLADGSMDPSFSSDGFLTAPGDQGARAVLLQDDGRLVAVGGSSLLDNRLRVHRFLPDGTPDLSFGEFGTFETLAGGLSAVGLDAALQEDGRIVVVGRQVPESGSPQLLLLRLLPNGTPDPDFGAAGVVLVDFSPDADALTGVTIQPDGRLLVCGDYGHTSTTGGACVLRFDEHGNLDPSFDDDGVLLIPGSPSQVAPEAIAFLSDSRILMVGDRRTSVSASSDQEIRRLLWNGDPDHDFGVAGVQPVDFGVRRDAAFDLAADSGGDILVAGSGAGAMSVCKLDGGLAFSAVPVPGGGPPTLVGRPWPNPTTRGARVDYVLGQPATTSARVFDVGGRLVRQLLSPTWLPAGPHEVHWDGHDARNGPASPGVYFIRLTLGDESETRRVVVTR